MIKNENISIRGDLLAVNFLTGRCLMKRVRSFLFRGITLLVIGIFALPIGTAIAVPVVLDVNGYGYNTIDGAGNG